MRNILFIVHKLEYRLKLFLVKKKIGIFYTIIFTPKILIFHFVDCDTLDDNGTKSYASGMVSNNNLILYFYLQL